MSKFKVGDKVRVVDGGHISAFTNDVKVGYTGIINLVDNDDNYNPYRVKFDELGVRNGWWFTDECIELVSDDTNKPKPKFKVGDKVKVVDVKQISSCTDDVKVGYVGVIIEVDKFDEEKPYKVKLDKCYNGWWFTESDLELVEG